MCTRVWGETRTPPTCAPTTRATNTYPPKTSAQCPPAQCGGRTSTPERPGAPVGKTGARCQTSPKRRLPSRRRSHASAGAAPRPRPRSQAAPRKFAAGSGRGASPTRPQTPRAWFCSQVRRRRPLCRCARAVNKVRVGTKKTRHRAAPEVRTAEVRGEEVGQRRGAPDRAGVQLDGQGRGRALGRERHAVCVVGVGAL